MAKPTINELAAELLAMRQHLGSLRAELDGLGKHGLPREFEVAQLRA